VKSITIVSPIYYPETNAGAKRSTAIAEFLATKGWKVTVVTLLPHHPQNKIYDGYDLHTPHTSNINGVTIHRFRPWIVPKDNFILRLFSELLFSWQAFLYLLTYKSDVVLGTCPYIFVGPFSLLASKLKGSSFVWDVRDLIWLYPKAAGKRTLGIDRMIDVLMQFTSSQSSLLITATEGLLRYFKKKPQASYVIANGVNQKTIIQLAKLNPVQFNQPNVLYAGLFGYNHGLPTIVNAARLLSHIPFTFSGDGPERQKLEQMVTRYQLNNVRFTGYLSFEELLEEYAKAAILVSHVRRDPLFEWTQPAKVWEYMATGKPVIHAGEGEVIDLIQKHNIAMSVPPEDPQKLADAITYLINHPEEARALGQRGREFVENQRNREKLLADLETMLNTLL
jgi:glycosyltransferase involved in cell wall biosynthesis